MARALAIIDADGLAELSTRRLARELRVSAPSLYNHFRTKEDILDAVADAIVARVDLSMFGRLPWAAALTEWARAYRAALAAQQTSQQSAQHGAQPAPGATPVGATSSPSDVVACTAPS